MGVFARLGDGVIAEYPLYLGEIRRRYPNTSFPAVISGADLPEDYVEVMATAAPETTRWQTTEEGPPHWVDGQWRQAWTVIDKSVPIEAKRAEIKQEIEVIAARARNAFVAGISPAEMAGWSLKRSEALAYRQSGNVADAPNLVPEASARGIELAILADKVLLKAEALAAVEAQIAGRCGALQDAVGAVEDDAALLTILAKSANGWPELE